MFNETFTVIGSSLRLLGLGENGIISRLRKTDETTLQQIQSMGLLPGSPIRLEQRSPNFVVCSDNHCFSLDEAAVQAIYVRITP